MGSLEHNFMLRDGFCFVFLLFFSFWGPENIQGDLNLSRPVFKSYSSTKTLECPTKKKCTRWYVSPLVLSCPPDTEQGCLGTQNKWNISMKVLYFEYGTASCQWVTSSAKAEVLAETIETTPPCHSSERGDCREHCVVTHWTRHPRGHIEPHWRLLGGKSIAYLRHKQAGHGGRNLILPSPILTR